MVEYVDFLGEIQHAAALTRTMVFRIEDRVFGLCVSKNYIFLSRRTVLHPSQG